MWFKSLLIKFAHVNLQPTSVFKPLVCSLPLFVSHLCTGRPVLVEALPLANIP